MVFHFQNVRVLEYLSSFFLGAEGLVVIVFTNHLEGFDESFLGAFEGKKVFFTPFFWSDFPLFCKFSFPLFELKR